MNIIKFLLPFLSNDDSSDSSKSASTDEEFAKLHKVGFCKIPTDIDELPALKASSSRFIAPATIDLRDYCTKTEDQGSKPWCAAYTAAQWCENIKWRINDYPENVDPTWIYSYAKSIDGDPKGDGTTLVAVLKALLYKKLFDEKLCKIKVISKGSSARSNVKYAIHKFGCILGAFNITQEWYTVRNGNMSVKGINGYESVGGHAVLFCGYNRDGVIIQNSWGEGWGSYGFGLISWNAFDQQFLYAAVLSNALDGLTLNT